jgi:site-specific DNA-methyltransferase (adenine-specific)
MTFNPSQGRRLYEWFVAVSRELFRILKPGGFFFSFSSPRLYHRMACAIEDAGFHIRDCFLWLYTQSRPKAMSLFHFVERMPLSAAARAELEKRLAGWKTPQVKSCFEPIVVAQKPPEQTLLENFLRSGVGLFNTGVRIGQNMFPANVLLLDGVEEALDRYFLVPKPGVEERGDFNTHPTVKPVALCAFLIRLSTSEGAVVLAPFVGSGTTAVAACTLNRRFIGIEINPAYADIAWRRLHILRRSSGGHQPEKSTDETVATSGPSDDPSES